MKKVIFVGFGLIVGILGMLAYQYFEAEGLEPIVFQKLKNVRFRNLNLPPDMSVVFASDIALDNPNSFGVQVAGLDFDVYVDDRKSTHINQRKSIKIPSNDGFLLPIEFKIPLNEKELVKNIKEVISGAWKKRAIQIRLEGHIQVDALGVKPKIPFSYQEVYRLEDYL